MTLRTGQENHYLKCHNFGLNDQLLFTIYRNYGKDQISGEQKVCMTEDGVLGTM